MDRVFQLREIPGSLVKEGKPHRIMSVGNWESDGVMEQSPRRRNKRFGENDWSYCGRPKNPVPVIERFSAHTVRAGVETLVIPRCFTIGIQPLSEISENRGYSTSEPLSYICRVHLADDRRRMTDDGVQKSDIEGQRSEILSTNGSAVFATCI